MPIRVLLDSTVFLFAYKYPRSNSRTVLNRIDGVDILPVVSYLAIKEVQHRSRQLYGKDISGLVRLSIITLPNLKIVRNSSIRPLIQKYQPLVADVDDVPHICAYFAGNCDYFVTSDRRLAQMRIREMVRFQTPGGFVEGVLGLRPAKTPDGV